MACLEETLRFPKYLKTIGDNLWKRDTSLLCFLCKDLLSAETLAEISGGFHLLCELEEAKLISDNDVSFIIELMELIRRRDLIRITRSSRGGNCDSSKGPKINPYRRLLLALIQDVTTTDVKDIKMTLRRFELRLDHVTDMFELLTVMENQRVIAPDNVNLLFHVLPYKRQKRKVLEYLGVRRGIDPDPVEYGQTTFPAPALNNTTASASADVSVHEMRSKLDRFRDDQLCRICMDGEMSTVFLPCKHMVTCTSCANAVSSCPVCRADIGEVIRFYKT